MVPLCLSARRRLLAGLLVVACVGVVALVTIHRGHHSVGAAHERATTRSMPLADAADELEISALTMALSLARYAREGDPGARAEARRASAAFDRALADARRLARSARRRAVLDAADRRFAQLQAIGVTMIERRDRSDRAAARVLAGLNDLEDRLDGALAGRRSTATTALLLGMQTDVAALDAQLAGFRAGGGPGLRAEALETVTELRTAARAAQRRDLALMPLVDAIGLAAGTALEQEGRLRVDEAVAESRRAALVGLLDRRVQPMAAEDLRADQRSATSSSRRASAVSALGVLLLLGVAFAAFALLVRALAGRLHDATLARQRLEASEARLVEQATTDTLTGLANRVLLVDRIEQALLRRRRHAEEHVALLFLDLDDFKAVNDAHGHEIGDEVLVEIAGRLRTVLRAADTVARPGAGGGIVARLGGDEFVLLLEGLGGPRDAERIADRVLMGLAPPVRAAGQQLFLDASIGIALAAPGDGRAAGDLLREGDTAMYAAKQGGKGRAQVFEPEMHAAVLEQAQLERDLRRAAPDGQLRLLYQPQVDVATGRFTGVEALVRWEHPQRGLLAPDAFVPTAEHTGDIVAIDDWVLREACRQLRVWDDAGLEPIEMAVNVSARRLVSGDLARDVARVLGATGIAPQRLELELTETVAVEHDAVAVEAIADVRALGVRVAIDDFGMGHSALSRLQSFPVDRLKIDRSFVASLTTGGERGSIVDAMLALGQSLGLQVVAEGVETKDHLQALRVLGCSTAQGYLFSRPVPAAEAERLLRSGPGDAVAAPAPAEEATTAEGERMVRNLLAELQRVTGLESTYLTRIDWAAALQHLTHVRNAGRLEIAEGAAVDWSDTVCRRALEQGVTYTDDVAAELPGSETADELGLRTYVSVPLRDGDGEVTGTLCGASTRSVPLAPEAIRVMERFADLIAKGVASGAVRA